ncbi:DUF3570 domain-containing protein [Methylocaldum sp. MU1018]
MAATESASSKMPDAENQKDRFLTSAYRHVTGLLRSIRAKPKPSVPVSASLHALTAAALSLPGVMPSQGFAAEEEVGFQYGYYRESNRNLFGVKSRFKPIEVDSLHGSAAINLTDRLKSVFNYTQDVWSGATPIATAPLSFGGNKEGGVIAGATPFLQNNFVAFDRQHNPLKLDPSTGKYVKDTQLVHTLSSASPEVRKQGDINLTYEWDEVALNAGAGISGEPDYESRFGNLGVLLDFNQKLTTLNLDLSYTNSDTRAIIDHDAAPYIWDTTAGFQSYNDTSDSSLLRKEGGNNVLHGNRQDWATVLGLSQVLSKNTLFKTDFGYTRSTGYLANPYKVVETAFIDPAQTGDILNGVAIGLLEKRPDERNQFIGNMHLTQYIDGIDAAVHFDYRLFHDDWGITSHTFEGEWIQPVGNGWTIAPRIRYYSQDAADFYVPYLVSDQAFSKNAVDSLGRPILVDANNPNNGKEYFRDANFDLVDGSGNKVDESVINPINKKIPFDRSKLPAHYSSDHRLSGFGALSGGITVTKQFARGIRLEAGAEYYSHAGSLKLGGGGEGNYSDFSYYMVNATLKVDLEALPLNLGEDDGGHGGHDHHAGHGAHGHHGAHAPAGVMFDHMLSKAGDMMVGVRYMYGTQSGDMLRGSNRVGDSAIVQNGCNGDPCYITPREMNMHMIMLDLMYAPTDWLNLMLMPQFVDMNMSNRELAGAPPASFDQQNLIQHHTLHEHTTGGVGDTGMYALFKLFDTPVHHVHGTLGVSAPTGDVDLKFRDTHRLDVGFQHYGMQLGSGTWDFKPSLTYTGRLDRYSWGAQVNGTVRLEDKNESGFAFGDIFQTTAWGSYSLLDWLSASIRGVYTVQGTIRGEYNGTFNKLGPMDYPSNYGGRYWDVGFGLNAFVPTGELRGHNLSFEWIQPVSDDVNGTQLRREGALSATWSYAF